MTSLKRFRNGLLAVLGLCLITPALHAVGNKLSTNSTSAGKPPKPTTDWACTPCLQMVRCSPRPGTGR